MVKKDKCKGDKVRTVMGEFKRGELKTSSGVRVRDRKQAIAIALSEADRYCFKQRGGAATVKEAKWSEAIQKMQSVERALLDELIKIEYRIRLPKASWMRLIEYLQSHQWNHNLETTELQGECDERINKIMRELDDLRDNDGYMMTNKEIVLIIYCLIIDNGDDNGKGINLDDIFMDQRYFIKLMDDAILQ